METRNLTIMFTDLSDYTAKTSISSRSKFLEMLDTYESLLIPIFARFKGKIVNEIGDAFMVVFESSTNAVLCGISIQDAVFKHNQALQNQDPLRVKVAISTGEAHIRRDNIYGEVVNIASRLEKIVRPNDVYFTEGVYLAMNKAEIPSIYVGEQTFKGIPRKVKVYKVLGKYHRILLAKKRKKEAFMWRVKSFVLVLLTVLILAALYFYLSSIGVNLFGF